MKPDEDLYVLLHIRRLSFRLRKKLSTTEANCVYIFNDSILAVLKFHKNLTRSRIQDDFGPSLILHGEGLFSHIGATSKTRKFLCFECD